MGIEGSSQQSSALLIYQVDPYEIHYLKFILEAYDGLATLTTLDSQKGLIQLAVPPGSKGSLEDLLEALGQELELKRVTTSEIRNSLYLKPKAWSSGPGQIA